jgi:diguanylate cyclase (GGDEF)-like protein/PAS domain S-box-containing protein
LSEPTTIPVLVQSASRDPVEALNSLLRNGGLAVQCHWVAKVADIGEAITRQLPDLLLSVAPSSTELAELAAIRDRLASAVPVVVIRDQINGSISGADMAQGASATTTMTSPGHVQAVIRRELRVVRIERTLTNTLRSAQEYRRQLESVLDRTDDAIAQVQEGIVVRVNGSWLKLFGHDEPGALVGQPVMDLFSAESHAPLKGALAACLQGRWSDHLLKCTVVRADGALVPLELVLISDEHEGEPCVQLVVPARKRDEVQLASELADAVGRDPTTGLWLRQQLLRQCAERLTHPPVGGVRCLIELRPDKFATLAGDLGATVTEELLALYAGQVRAMLRPNDLAGHFGAASLLLLLERGNARDAEAWVEETVERIAQQVFAIGERSVRMTCSAGVALLTNAEVGIDEGIAIAQGAARKSEERGGNQVTVNERVNQDTRILAYDQIWVKHIKSALAENRFHLVQHPIASLSGSDRKFSDIAVRMLDNQSREVLPSEFLPAAERNDLLRSIDRWVLTAALGLIAKRQPDMLFVRLSRDSMLDDGFIDWLDGQLKTTLAEPQRLCLQLSEEVATRYMQPARQLFEELSKRRIKVALEGFGTGPDSGGLVGALPVDFLKIDGSLMQGLAGNPETQKHVRDIVDIANKRAIQTIAERIEDANTMAVVWQLGVQYIQGYLVHASEEVVLKS